MTAWQDQPPLSRRQVRQNERSGSAEGQLDVDAARPREGWDVDARRASAPESTPSSESTPAPVGNPASDQTPASDSAPVTRAAVAGGRRAQRDVGPAAAAEQTPFRVRDFSPEARPSLTAQQNEEWAPPVTPSEQDAGARATSFPAPSAPTPVVAPPVVAASGVAPTNSAAPEERTMTRRELRAREQRALQEKGLAGPSVVSAPAPTPAPQPVAETPAPGFDDLLAPTSDTPVRADVVETVAPPALVDPLIRPLVAPGESDVQTPGESLSLLDHAVEEQTPAPLRLRDRFRRQAAPVDATPVDAASDDLATDDDVPEDEVIVAEIIEPVAAPAAEAPVADARVAEAPVAQAPVAQSPAGPTAPVAPRPAPETVSEPSTDTGSFVPPVGHWSTQATIDDDEQFQQQQPLARNIGATSGAITTNALVIPSLPSEELLRPLGATGEILITGSIDLPRSMGATGAHPARYDHSDVDALLEADDREDAHPESAPVRAIRAVSTHTSTRGVMDARKPKGNSRLPIILGVTGAVLVVGIVALVVAGMIFKIF